MVAKYGYMSLLPDADSEKFSATLPKHFVINANSAKAWCKVPLLKPEGHSGGTCSVKLHNMSGHIIGGAAIVSITLAFDFQHGFNCRVSSPSVSSKPVAILQTLH
ncbi:TPA: hypothetical protein ACH3X1_002160 [Trebouxia sp. C0004]